MSPVGGLTDKAGTFCFLLGLGSFVPAVGAQVVPNCSEVVVDGDPRMAASRAGGAIFGLTGVRLQPYLSVSRRRTG